MLALPINLPSPTPERDSSEDELRDHDDLSWLATLSSKDRAAFGKRVRWARLVDRLAAEGLLEGDAEALAQHDLMPQDPAELGVSWCEAWQGYLLAAARYRQAPAPLQTLEEHGEMLLEVGGNAFCLMPNVDWYLRRSIAHFGALDRFFTNLRDLAEDSRRGRCHFPAEVLARFGLTPRDFTGGRWRRHPGYRAFLHYWLDRYLPALRHEAAEFCNMPNLPRPLALLREACLERHARIERTLRACSFDFEKAYGAYWAEVSSNVPRPAALQSCA